MIFSASTGNYPRYFTSSETCLNSKERYHSFSRSTEVIYLKKGSDMIYIKTQVFRLLRYYSPAPRNIARSDWVTQKHHTQHDIINNTALWASFTLIMLHSREREFFNLIMRYISLMTRKNSKESLTTIFYTVIIYLCISFNRKVWMS